MDVVSVSQIAGGAPAVREMALPTYPRRFLRRDYRQPYLSILLVLRQFLGLDYRGIVVLVTEWRELREDPELGRVAHYLMLADAAPRLLASAEVGRIQDVQAALIERAVNAAGPEARHASAYFGLCRANSSHWPRTWPKLIAFVDLGSHSITSPVPGIGRVKR
jgi:hypothetical protein